MSADFRGPRRPRPSGTAVLVDKIRSLRAAALQDKWDGAAWEQAGHELLSSVVMSDDVRMAFEELLNVFPTAGLYWARYLELELNAGNLEEGKLIIGRCLLSCPVLELWSQYLRFIKKNSEGKGPDALAEVRKAYEFTLDQLGVDIGSGPLWQEYIAYLRTPKVGSPGFAALFPQAMAGQEESSRMLALRKAYQRAIVVPNHALETLWRDWEMFETGGKQQQQQQQQLGRKIIDEWRPRYQAARAVHRDRKRRLDTLSATMLPLPPGKGGLLQETQVMMRREYLDWERSNPQRLDPSALNARLTLAYEQAAQVLARYPDLWFDYARWHADGGGAGPAQAATVLAKADQTLPHCLLLRFTLADIEETQGNVEQAREVYERLASALEAEAASTSAAANSNGGAHHSATAAAPPGHSLGWTPEQGGLLWVNYMRFLRRAEGDMAARKVFLRARRWPGCTWHVYAATALAEWQSGRDAAIARNIFEKGLEEARHLRNPQYILQYLQFLSDAGDVDNAHSLLERVLGEDTNSRCLALWERYIQLELQAGDLRGAAQVEQRARQALQLGPREVLALGVRRQRFLDLWPCSADQQKHLESLLGLSKGAGEDGQEDLLGSTAPREPEPIKQLPTQLGLFINDLPPPQALEGPVPDVERVIQVLLGMDLSPAGVASACIDLEQRYMGGGGGGPAGPPSGPPPQDFRPGPPGPHQPPSELPHFVSGIQPPPPPQQQYEDPAAAAAAAKRRHGEFANGGHDDDDDGFGGGGHLGGGQDIYRMRLKQQRG